MAWSVLSESGGPCCKGRAGMMPRPWPWPWVLSFVAVLSLLAWAVSAYAGASAEARLFGAQLDTALVALVVADERHAAEMAVSDSLLAQQDSAQAADTAAVNAAAVVSDATATATAGALADARRAAAGMPVVQAALARVEEALAVSEAARQVERAESAAAVFAGQQRERVLGMQLLNERAAAADKDVQQDLALSLSMQESAAWQRAATPGLLKSVWQQGRAALVVGVIAWAVASR